MKTTKQFGLQLFTKLLTGDDATGPHSSYLQVIFIKTNCLKPNCTNQDSPANTP